MNGLSMRKARQDLGMTQADFGGELGYSRVMISQMETGAREIDRRTGHAVRWLAARSGLRAIADRLDDALK